MKGIYTRLIWYGIEYGKITAGERASIIHHHPNINRQPPPVAGHSCDSTDWSSP